MSTSTYAKTVALLLALAVTTALDARAQCTGVVRDATKCGEDFVTCAVESGKCGVKIVDDAARCGAKYLPSDQCGRERITSGAKCGWNQITSGAKCGWNKVTSGAKCGWNKVTSGAKCGWNQVTSGATCGWNQITSGAKCGWYYITDVGQKIKKCLECIPNPSNCDCKDGPKTCDDKDSPKTCDDKNSPKTCDDTSSPKTCDDKDSPKTCDDKDSPKSCDDTSSPKSCDGALKSCCAVPDPAQCPQTCKVPKTCGCSPFSDDWKQQLLATAKANLGDEMEQAMRLYRQARAQRSPEVSPEKGAAAAALGAWAAKLTPAVAEGPKAVAALLGDASKVAVVKRLLEKVARKQLDAGFQADARIVAGWMQGVATPMGARAPLALPPGLPKRPPLKLPKLFKLHSDDEEGDGRPAALPRFTGRLVTGQLPSGEYTPYRSWSISISISGGAGLGIAVSLGVAFDERGDARGIFQVGGMSGIVVGVAGDLTVTFYPNPIGGIAGPSWGINANYAFGVGATLAVSWPFTGGTPGPTGTGQVLSGIGPSGRMNDFGPPQEEPWLPYFTVGPGVGMDLTLVGAVGVSLLFPGYPCGGPMDFWDGHIDEVSRLQFMSPRYELCGQPPPIDSRKFGGDPNVCVLTTGREPLYDGPYERYATGCGRLSTAVTFAHQARGYILPAGMQLLGLPSGKLVESASGTSVTGIEDGQAILLSFACRPSAPCLLCAGPGAKGSCPDKMGRGALIRFRLDGNRVTVLDFRRPHELVAGMKIGLYSPANQRFVRVNDSGLVDGDDPSANPNAAPPSRPLRVLSAEGPGRYALLASADDSRPNDGRLLRLGMDGKVVAGSPRDYPKQTGSGAPQPIQSGFQLFKARADDQFELVDAGDGQVALYNPGSSRFLRMQADGTCDSSQRVSGSASLPPDWTLERFFVVAVQ